MLLQMYPTILTIHSYWRWVVLLTAAVAIVSAVVGLMSRRSFAPWGRKAGVLYITSLDMQFLLGLLLYAASPIVWTAWGNMGAAMKVQELRFFSIEHLITMILAVALAHIGSVRVKKAATDLLKYRRMAVWYAASLVLILLGLPWWRPFFRGTVGG